MLRAMRREGSGLPAPQAGSARVFYLLWTHIWKLIRVNLLFLVFSIPIVTLPAALCAMNRVLIKLVREGNVLLWEEFRDEFKGDFLRSLPLGLLFGGLLFVSYYLLSLGMGNLGSFVGLVILALGLLVLVYALGRGGYAFLMRAMFDLSTGDLLKNANAMAAMRGGRGWAPVLLELGGFFLGFSFFPYSLPVIVLIGPALLHYFLCCALNDPIQTHIISPWEALQTQKEA